MFKRSGPPVAIRLRVIPLALMLIGATLLGSLAGVYFGNHREPTSSNPVAHQLEAPSRAAETASIEPRIDDVPLEPEEVDQCVARDVVGIGQLTGVERSDATRQGVDPLAIRLGGTRAGRGGGK